MQEITIEQTARKFERLVNYDAAQIRHRANQDVAAYAQKLVRGYAPLSNTSHRGRLRNWQEGREQGNRGGYVKVQAAKSPSGKNGAGAITNYVENGHINHRGGRCVPGAQFYAAAKPLAEAYAKRRFQQAGDEIAKILNGG